MEDGKRVTLVFLTAEKGTGSQSEWEQLDSLMTRMRIEVEGSALITIDYSVVDTDSVARWTGSTTPDSRLRYRVWSKAPRTHIYIYIYR